MPVPKVSIVIPSLNMLNLLQNTVEGIAKTCDVSFEVIVVNNGSSDNTKEWLETLAEQTLKQNPNFVKLIKIHNKYNRFLSGAINQAILHSSGKYISIVANDILVPPKMYSFFIDLLEKDTEHKYGAVGPWYTEDPRFTDINNFYKNYDNVPKRNEWTNQWHFSVCYILRREDWDIIGEWDECMESSCQDNDWGLRAELAGFFQTAYKGIVCAHTYGSFGRGQLKNERKISINDSRYFHKKWGIYTDKGVKDIKDCIKKKAEQGNYISSRQKRNVIKFENKIQIEEPGRSLFR